MGRSASKKKAIATRTASDAEKDREVDCNCGLCCEPVKDEEDDGLYCEGTCAQWFHRYCAGVTVPQFKRLSNSSSPFLCYACFQEEHRAKVSSLEEKVAALTAELIEVKTTLESSRREAASHSWTDVVKRGRRGHSHGAKSNGMSSRSVSATAQRAAAGMQQARAPESTSARPTDSSVSTQPQRIRVEGVRRIWGTLKSATTAAVSATLKKLWPACSSITLRRKVRVYEDSNKTRWWFILRGDESILQTMEKDWDRVQMQTNWKLEHCTAPSNPENSPANGTNDGISSANAASKSSPVNLSPSSTSPEKCSNTVHLQPSNLQTIHVEDNSSNSTDVMTDFQPQQSTVTVPDSFLLQSQGQNGQT